MIAKKLFFIGLLCVTVFSCDKKSDFVFVEGNDKVSDFYICSHEVTQAEYQSVIGTNPSDNKGENNPVENVTWYDAINYCNKLSEKEGLTPCYIAQTEKQFTLNKGADGYRLPTETEWEYAAGGGNKSKGYKYSGGDALIMVGWISQNSERKSHPVKTKTPNELGIYDMSGNVSEWCWDGYGEDYPNATKDYAGLDSSGERVYRGGDFFGFINECTVKYRDSDYPGYRYPNRGFRVVKSVSK